MNQFTTHHHCVSRRLVKGREYRFHVSSRLVSFDSDSDFDIAKKAELESAAVKQLEATNGDPLVGEENTYWVEGEERKSSDAAYKPI